MGYTCADCGEYHDELPLGWGFTFPLGVDEALSALEADVMERRHWLVVDELLTAKDDARTRHFFVKGNLEVPIVDHTDDLVFTVWSTLDKEIAFRAIDLWFDDARVEEPPAAGYLQNDVPLFDEPSLNLPCTVHWRPASGPPSSSRGTTIRSAPRNGRESRSRVPPSSPRPRCTPKARAAGRRAPPTRSTSRGRASRPRGPRRRGA